MENLIDLLATLGELVFLLLAIFGFLWWIVLLIKRLFGVKTVKDEKGNEVPISERIVFARSWFLGSVIMFVACYIFVNGFVSLEEANKQMEQKRIEREATEKIERERKEQEEKIERERREQEELATKQEMEYDDKNNHDFVEITARDLMGTLKSNAARANALFNQKYVKIIDGVVVNIESDGDYINIDAPGGFGLPSVQCYPKYDSTKEQIFYLSKGQYVTIYGQITRVGEVLGYSLTLLKIE